MTWVRIDDAFGENPKIARLTDSAVALYVTGLAYCNRNLTDGFIPSMVGLGQLRYCEGNAIPIIHELEDLDMWESVPGGWQVHDFDEYQPSKQDVLDERAKKQAAGRAGGLASAKARAEARVQAGAEAPAQAESKPVPVPVPVPEVQTRSSKARTASTKPTEDQTYLAAKISDAWGLTNGHLGPAALQKLNTEFGVEKVSSSLRLLRGFPPSEAVESAYAYLVEMCRADA